jgi:hypothetical protein
MFSQAYEYQVSLACICWERFSVVYLGNLFLCCFWLPAEEHDVGDGHVSVLVMDFEARRIQSLSGLSHSKCRTKFERWKSFLNFVNFVAGVAECPKWWIWMWMWMLGTDPLT